MVKFEKDIKVRKTRLKDNPRPRVGCLKIRLRPCQDHDWPAMSRPCLTRPCCQDQICPDYVKTMLVKTMLDKTMFDKTMSRPCLTGPCLSRPCLTRPFLPRSWSILDQFNPFLSNLIQFEHVCSSLNHFNLFGSPPRWILWSHFDTFFWIKFMNMNKIKILWFTVAQIIGHHFEFWIRRLDLLPDEFYGLILTHFLQSSHTVILPDWTLKE